ILHDVEDVTLRSALNSNGKIQFHSALGTFHSVCNRIPRLNALKDANKLRKIFPGDSNVVDSDHHITLFQSFTFTSFANFSDYHFLSIELDTVTAVGD